MKTKTRIYKFISSLLTVAVISACGLFAAAPEPVYAMNTADLINHIKSFNHGGTGSLNARISVNGSNIINVTGTVTGATNALDLDINSGVTVQWAADYSGSADGMIALSGAGTFEVAAAGSIKNNNTAGGHVAIKIVSSNVTVNVSGGTVSSQDSNAIACLSNGYTNNVINMSGGMVSSPYTCILISSINSNVNISGGTVINTAGPTAIGVTGSSSTVTVSGGFLFACGTSPIGGNGAVIRGDAIISGSAVVCAWDKPSGTPTYNEGTSTDLVFNSTATVKWGKSGSQAGINYSNGASSGFFPISGVTVNPSATTYSVVVSNGTGSNSYTVGATVNIAASPAPAGKAFDKWTATGVTLSNPGNANTSFPMPANAVTVTATYKDAATYTVTFKYDNGEPDSVLTVNAGDKADYGMDPVKSGYTFAGWCSDAACTTAYNFNTPVTANITLYAKWTGGASYTVSVSSGEGGTAKANVASAMAGDTVKLTLEEDEGYMFKEWQIVSGHVVINGNEFTMPGENIIIKAVFEPASGEGGAYGDDITNADDSADSGDTGALGNADGKNGGFNPLWILVIILAAAAAGGWVFFTIARKKDKAQADKISMEDKAQPETNDTNEYFEKMNRDEF